MLRRVAHLLCLVVLLVAGHRAMAEPYLAPGTWPDDRAAVFEGWFGGHLAAMNEPSLAGGSEATVARVLFLPSFSAPQMVRLTAADDAGMTFAYKATDGAGGYEPGGLTQDENGAVPPETAARVLAMIDRMGIWSGKVTLEKRDPTKFCLDGTRVFLEFSRPGTWVPVSRHDCDMAADDPLRLLVKEMGTLAGHPFDDPQLFR